MTNNSIIGKKSYSFAIKIVEVYMELKSAREYELASQLLRSGTSIGANVAEANGAISNADFSAKMSIAYKESLETKFWLSILKDTKFLDEIKFDELNKDADELSRILFSIIKKMRIDTDQSK